MTKIHLFYSLAIICNFVVVAIYWPVIHPKTIPKHLASGYMPLIICQYWVHSVPAICCLINSYITNIVLVRRLIVPIVMLGISYTFVNFVTTKSRGRPTYAFLHWQNYETLFIVLYLLTGVALFYLLICFIDEFFKADLVKKRKDKIDNK